MVLDSITFKFRQTLYPRNLRYMMEKLYPRTLHAFLMGLERIFGDFDARPPTYLIYFKWTFDVHISTVEIVYNDGQGN